MQKMEERRHRLDWGGTAVEKKGSDYVSAANARCPLEKEKKKRTERTQGFFERPT